MLPSGSDGNNVAPMTRFGYGSSFDFNEWLRELGSVTWAHRS
jgi:hypothetical protein